MILKWKKMKVKSLSLKKLKENQLKKLLVKNLHLNKALKKELLFQDKNENVKLLTNLKIKNKERA